MQLTKKAPEFLQGTLLCTNSDAFAEKKDVADKIPKNLELYLRRLCRLKDLYITRKKKSIVLNQVVFFCASPFLDFFQLNNYTYKVNEQRRSFYFLMLKSVSADKMNAFLFYHT